MPVGRLILFGLMIIVTLLFVIDCCIGKNFKIKLFFGGATVLGWLIFMPVLLDLILTEKYYEFFHIYSVMEEPDWFAFFGSYMGVVGTIVIGLITLKQADILAKKDEKLSSYQAKPRMQINTVSALPWYSGSKVNLLKEKELEQATFIQYGENVTVMGSFVIIVLEVVDIGSLPVERLDINQINWRINNKTYKIKLIHQRWKNLDLLSKIHLIIDGNDETDEHFYEEVARHFKYKNNHEVGYGKSELQVFYNLSNAEHLNIPYRLICRFDMDNAPVHSDYVVSDIIHIRRLKENDICGMSFY